jgi:ABC-2 type transport system permease protein
MATVFRYTMKRLRGQVIGWGIGLFLLGLLLVSLYDEFAGQQEALNELLAVYPQELMAFFGDFSNMGTPEGWLGIEFFSYMPLVLGIFPILAGTGLLVTDEESGRLDLILGHPVSRSAMLFGRLFAFVVSSILICLIAWVGLIVPMLWSTMEADIGEVLLPFVSVFAEILLFGSIAIFLSLFLPSRRVAAMISGLFLVASFFITGFAEITDILEGVARFSPLTYYQSSSAMRGLNYEWLAGLFGVAVLFILFSWWLFERREIRVGGEGGWNLPSLRRLGMETKAVEEG